jgi:hypothetical protein
LINEHRAVLIDLDSVRRGDHLIDAGSLIANFYLNGLRAGNTVPEIDTAVDAFIAIYAESIPWPIDRARLNWYIADALLHEVLRRSLRQYDEQRLQHSRTYLDLSERFLACC